MNRPTGVAPKVSPPTLSPRVTSAASGTPNNASAEYLREAVYYLQVLAEQIGKHAWAIITHTTLDFGKARMLELIHDFIVFAAGVKKLCRHSQYFGVRAAQEVYAKSITQKSQPVGAR